MSLMPWSQPELEMSHASRLINSVLRWLPSALMIIGEDNQLLHINERARTLLRLEASESRYKTLLDLPYYLNDLKHLFLTEGEVDAARQELAITMPEEKEARIFGYTLRKEVLPDLGKVLIFVFSDITNVLKERRFKEQLKQELFQARKMKAMTTLISGMAEDLHNPFIALAMTQNMVETTLNNLQELLLASENAEDFAMLDRHNQRLIQVNDRATELLGDLALYACPPRLELEKDCWAVYLEETLENWKAETLVGMEGVTVTFHNEAPEGWASFDSRQMKEAILHLLRNALEAKAPDRDLALSVQVSIEPASEFFPIAQLVTHVSDTGTGIKPEVFDFIFDPRFTTKGERASGLGLSLAYQTLNRHGGSLLAQSEVDKGSTFTLKLPLEEVPEYLR